MSSSKIESQLNSDSLSDPGTGVRHESAVLNSPCGVLTNPVLAPPVDSLQRASNIHEMAATGFNLDSDAYERGRPEYPVAVADFFKNELRFNPLTRIGELGAGTGKFTRTLLKTGAEITPMEPVEGMRRKFRAIYPNFELLSSPAEKIDLRNSSLDVVAAAQAAHWFDAPKAAVEIHRVLKTAGHLVLVWNVRDETSGIFRELTRIMEKYEGTTPRYKSMKWKAGFDQSGLFSTFRLAEFPHTQHGTAETIVDRVGSVSFMSALPSEEKAKALKKVREIVSHHPDVRGKAEIELKYITRVYVATSVKIL